jgi:hypothetical protein
MALRDWIQRKFCDAGLSNCFLHRWKLTLDRIPDHLTIYLVIAMPQDIAHAAKTFPVLMWTQDISMVPNLFAASVIVCICLSTADRRSTSASRTHSSAGPK